MVELTEQREAAASTSVTARAATPESAIGYRILMRNFGEEKVASEPFVYMPSMVSDGTEVS